MCKKICTYLYMTRLSDLSLHMPRQGQKHLVVHPLHLFQWNMGPFLVDSTHLPPSVSMLVS